MLHGDVEEYAVDFFLGKKPRKIVASETNAGATEANEVLSNGFAYVRVYVDVPESVLARFPSDLSVLSTDAVANMNDTYIVRKGTLSVDFVVAPEHVFVIHFSNLSPFDIWNCFIDHVRQPENPDVPHMPVENEAEAIEDDDEKNVF